MRTWNSRLALMATVAAPVLYGNRSATAFRATHQFSHSPRGGGSNAARLSKYAMTPFSLSTSRRDVMLLRGGAEQQKNGAGALSMSSLAGSSVVSKTFKGLLTLLARVLRELGALSRVQKLVTMGIFLLGYSAGRLSMQNPWTRYKSVLDIPASRFGPTAKPLVGVAASVSDGDTIRLLHVPTPFHASSLVKGQKVSEEALPIRICTLDTPETAKFGKSGQPFGEEAKKRLQELVEGKKLQVRLLQKDQYARAVAQVAVIPALPFMPRQCVDEVLLREGLAEVYQGGGAVYGPKGLDAYLQMEAKAREEKRGIWSLKNRESAAEYKKRTKE